MSGPTGSTTVFRVDDRKPSVADCDSLVCDFGGIVTNTTVITSLVLLGVAVVIALTHIQDAKKTCQDERECVLDERDAFEEFTNRVNSLDSVSPESSVAFAGGPSTGLHREISAKDTTESTLQQVFTIYRETVMSVPHYEADYDETVIKNMGAELGTDATMSLAANKKLSTTTQETLVTRGREAAAARTSLANAIDTELDALSNATSELTSINRRRRRLVEHLTEVRNEEVGAAIDIWNHLGELEAEAESAATERQKSLREPPMRINPMLPDASEVAFYAYLYGDSEGPQHPVLSQIIDQITTIREDRNQIASRIAAER